MVNEKIPLYFLDGVPFASDYERVVHGGRGDYIELIKKQFLIQLEPKFKDTVLPDEVSDEPFYYYWLQPKDRKEKIYWQIKTVKYADYKKGYYYISPEELKLFEEKGVKKYKSLF